LSHAHSPARWSWLATIVSILALILLVPAAAQAHGHHDHGHHGKDNRGLVVMTQNLYLGSSLGPALEAKTPEEFVEAVARIYVTVQYTNFPQRAEAIADEIQEKDPDLIGLQEVTKWTTGGSNPPPGYDFLAILENDLQARGLHYTAASIAHNAKIGPAPLALAEQGCVQPGPTITCQGVPIRSMSANLAPGRRSRSSCSTSMPFATSSS